MTKPQMTLPNGDVLYDGDYAVTRDGDTVGPICFNYDGRLAGWGASKSIVYTDTGMCTSRLEPCDTDLVAKWVEHDDTPVMTDYNDGKWHAHNGGECPVHPDSVVDVAMAHGVSKGSMAGFFTWGEDADGTIVAFRVTKPYAEPKKPREVWVNIYAGDKMGGLAYRSKEQAIREGGASLVRCVRMVVADE